MRAVSLGCLILAPTFLAGCPSDEPQASGRLDRPSGLVIAARPPETSASTGNPLGREDLLIADSEAQGVKIFQYIEGRSTGEFVPAPAAFFPLVVPAPGFPTEISLSGAGAGDRLYALSAGAALLNVLDVTPLIFGASAVGNEGNVLLGDIDLTALAGDALVPTDVEVVGTVGTQDLVAVSFQGIGAPDALMLIEVDASGGMPVVGQVFEAPIGPGPRGMGLVPIGTSSVALVVSSAGSDSVTEVAVDPLGTDPILGVRTIDAGGPTQDVVDAGAAGAFAVRVDRPAVVHLVQGPSGLERSSVVQPSPYAPLEDRGTDAVRGVIYTFDSPIGAASYGTVPQLADPSPRARVEFITGVSDMDSRVAGISDERKTFPGPALLLAHVDGTVSFVTADASGAALTVSSTASVVRVTRTTSVTPDLQVTECASGGVETCPASASGAPECPGLIAEDLPFFQTYRATYRGAMVDSLFPDLASCAETSCRSSSSTTTYRLSDPTVTSFEDRLVQVGDLVPTTVQSLVCRPDEILVEERSDVGVVRYVSTASDASSFIEVSYPGLGQIVTSCDGQAGPALGGAYRVRPGGDEVVLARVVGERILEVLSRQTVRISGRGAVVQFDQAISFELVAPTGFACEPGRRACVFDSDCGAGRICEERPLNTVESCPRFCQTSCAVNAEACLPSLTAEHCSEVEIEVSPTVPFVASLSITENSTNLPSAAPANAVFSTLRGSWLISYPGSRWIAEVGPGDDGVIDLGFIR